MTNQEFKNEFNISYNAIASNSAPGIDDYELSVYLTKAQLELVKNYYDPISNRKQKGFENTEKRRRDLDQLVFDYKIDSSFTTEQKIHPTSKFFVLPDDLFLIVNERIKIKSTDCFNNTVVNVKPMSYDAFNIQIKNPFANPDTSVAWRLDLSKIGNSKVVEIVSPYNIKGSLQYQLRYIKYPSPIIITDLAASFPSDNLSIDGITNETECELNNEICREIIDRAVALALRDYKSSGLESKLIMNNQNE